MSINFCIIGGDLRSFFLAKILAREKYEVKLYGFDKLENFKECEKYNEMISNSDNIVLPIPFSKDNQFVNMPFSNKDITIRDIFYYLENKTIFVGNIHQELKEELHRKHNQVIDFMQKEEFAILNAIPTAEATIEIILKNTNRILQNSNCLIMGFGRIGKILAYKLNALSAKVTCMITNEVERAWAIAYGYETTKIENLQKNCTKLKQYDIIINTIPKMILKEELKEIKKETLVIDLASKPYGIDRRIAEQEKLNFIEALGLPRKVSTNDNGKIYERNYKRRNKNMFLDIIRSIIFGIVEGITEWLPISSTGHLILVEQFLKFENVSPEFWSMFQVVIQLGAILAVVLLYFKKIWPITKYKENAMKPTGILSYFDKNIMNLWGKILIGCIPAAIIGLLFDETFETLFYNPICIAIALIVFGIAFIVIENWNQNRKSAKDKNSDITYKDALIIGVFQLLAAIFPGTSRSGATIIGGLLIGLSRPNAAEFTFYLAIPTMLGASLLKLVKFGLAFTGAEIIILLVGMVISFVVSMFVIKFLMNYIKKHDFKVFGYYRIILGIIVLAYFFFA